MARVNKLYEKPLISTIELTDKVTVGKLVNGEYKVKTMLYSEFLAQIVDDTLVLVVTRAELQALIASSGLAIGVRYIITNAVGSTLSLLTQAVSTTVLDEIAVNASNGDNVSYDITTDIATAIQQTQINGNGFVKASGTTLSYDNSTYLTTIEGIAAGGELEGNYASPTLKNSSVVGKVLTGLSVSGSAVLSTDSILTGIGKLQNQVNGLAGGVEYQGTWNASTNTPTLTSSVGTQGFYYVVSVAGSTNLNGITEWALGDWAIYNGTAWQKVDNTDAVVSVNGYTGIVTLSAADVSAVPTTRTITAGTGLTGGGDLTANRTFSIDSTVATLTGTQTLTNKTITSPIINEILDSNGNEILGFTPIASATDYITIKNGIGIGVPVHISAAGSSANTGLHLEPKGTGLVQISDGTDTTKGIRFRSSGSATSAVTLIDAVSSAGRVITLPNATGTVALTSDLTSYLPLAGGTLTGALNGTSANFSSTLASGAFTSTIATAGASNVIGYFNNTDYTAANKSAIRVRQQTGISTGFSAYLGMDGSTLFLSNDTMATKHLSITTAGAATFSSTLAVTGALTGSSTAQFTKIGIGNAPSATSFIFSNVNPTGGTSISAWRGIFSASNDITSRLNGVSIAVGTQASTTISDIVVYNAEGTSFGAGSSATRVTGFSVDGTLANALATNVYGFQGSIASGTGRWNLYMGGSAVNYLNGNLQLGSTTATAGAEKLQVTGTASISGALSIGNTVATAVAVASTHKVTIVIGGVTYYLLATNV